jgi:hypothetical protein
VNLFSLIERSIGTWRFQSKAVVDFTPTVPLWRQIELKMKFKFLPGLDSL